MRTLIKLNSDDLAFLLSLTENFDFGSINGITV